MGILTVFLLINAKPNHGTVQESSKSDCFSGKEMMARQMKREHLTWQTMYTHWPFKNKIKAVKIRFFSEKTK